MMNKTREEVKNGGNKQKEISELIYLTQEEFHVKKKQIGVIQEIVKKDKELYYN